MATPGKTIGTAVLSLQTISAGAVVMSSELDVTSTLGAWFTIHFGRTVETALAAPVRIRLEGRSVASGTGYWFPLFEIYTGTVAAASEALSNNESAGATLLEVASTSGISLHDQIFIKNTTIGNSDWQRIMAIVTNTSVTIEDGLRNGQNQMTFYTMAERFAEFVDLSAVAVIRLVVTAAACDQTTAVEAYMNTLDSFG